MAIDAPVQGQTLRQPFAVAGWALDLGAVDNGVDLVHVYAYPSSGAPPIFVGAASTNFARGDVGAYYGAAHVTSGYGLIVHGLSPGNYMLAVFAHSSYADRFAPAQTINVRIESSALLVLDAPSANATVSQGFLVGGWAADFGAASGGGIDLVHIYAYPLDTGAAPLFLGQVAVNVPRPDVAKYFGSQFSTTGFNLFAPSLAPGRYRVVAYGRSLVSGAFSAVAYADVSLR